MMNAIQKKKIIKGEQLTYDDTKDVAIVLDDSTLPTEWSNNIYDGALHSYLRDTYLFRRIVESYMKKHGTGYVVIGKDLVDKIIAEIERP